MPQDLCDFRPDPAAVERAVAPPPFLDREVLLRKTRDGFTYPEIGAILRLSQDAVEARFASALGSVRAQFGRKWRRRRPL
jgi:DNA-directed RNA polymerase specialized sigma24 family protein